MATHAELTLLSRLTDIESLELLARRGLDLDVIPDDTTRLVTQWAINYFNEDGCRQAPSREALLETWGQKLEDASIELGEEEDEVDTMEWAIDSLLNQWLFYETQRFTKGMANAIIEADGPDRQKVFQEHTTKLTNIALSMADHSNSADGAQGFRDRLRAYEEREASGRVSQGLTLALPAVDDHTFGIHPGELAVMAAPAKGGKSYLLGRAAFQEALAGRRVVLFTLENSVEMTLDRMVCMGANVDPQKWQRGEITADEKRQVQLIAERMEETQIQIIHPEHPTVASMVQQARLLGAESLYIDQLTFIEDANPGRKARHEVVRDIMRELKRAISSGPNKLPCLLAHQINREGIKAAEKDGGLDMTHLAESAEVERTADWVFGLYQTESHRLAGTASLKILAARRAEPKEWTVTWRPASGFISVLGQWNR